MRLPGRGLAAIFSLLCVCGGGDAVAAPANYPAKLITMIVPFAAGGTADLVARIVAESLSRTLGQHVVIENVVGAGGTTAATRTMRAAPDGYTVMIGTMGTHAAAAALHPQLAYNPATDFAPIGMIVTTPMLILAKKATPANTLPEFIAYARQNAATLVMARMPVSVRCRT